MSALTEALERILRWMMHHNQELASSLQPGLTYKEIADKVKDLPFFLSKEVYELYQWRNGDGQWSAYKDGLLLHYSFLPLEAALAEYSNWIKLNAELDYEAWSQYWLPIFMLDGKEYYIVVGDAKAKATSPVSTIFIEDGEPAVKHTSLTNMVQAIAEAYETGAYYPNEAGNLEEDEPKVAQILRKYNADSVEAALEILRFQLSLESLTKIATDLSRFKDSRTVEPLIHVLQVPQSEIPDPNENIGIRSLAATILGQLNDSRAVEPLIHALQHTHWMVRYSAVQSLGRLKDNRAVEPLINALKDQYFDIHRVAIWALGELEDSRAVEPLIQALHPLSEVTNSNPSMIGMVAATLGKLKDARAVEPIVETLQHGFGIVRYDAAFALGRLKDSCAVEPLIEALKDGDYTVRERAAWALGEIKDPRALEPLTQCLKDGNQLVQSTAQAALKKIEKKTRKKQ